MSSLYVGNLSSHVRHKELEDAFRRFGRSYLELKSGYGFVIYEEFQDAERALKALQGTSVCGEQPSIKWARGQRRVPRNYNRGGGWGRRGSLDKHQSQGSRRRGSMGIERRSDGGEGKPSDEVKEGSTARDIGEDRATLTREGEEDSDGKLGINQEVMYVDPLDGGRWDPRMDDSPEDIDEGHTSDHKDKEDRKHDRPDKSLGSSVADRHVERSSCAHQHRNSYDYGRRARDAVGRPRESCHRCGQYGHAKWQCNAGPRKGGFDSRRRYFVGRGGFRGIGSRFKGMGGGIGRRFNRKRGDFWRRDARQHGMKGEGRHENDGVHDEPWERGNKRRRRGSKSPKGSRSKRKHKKASKKLGRKRQRSSSTSTRSSPSAQPVHGTLNGLSSSSSPSKSRSRAHSRSSRSCSRSSSARSSHSRSSQDHSSGSRSISASSISRSRSASQRSRKSLSRSPLSHSAHPSQSPGIHGISSSPKEVFKGADSRSPKQDEAWDGTSSDKPDHALKGDDDRNETADGGYHSSESQDMEHEEERRRERRRVWSREVKRQKVQNKSDSEEPFHVAEAAKLDGGNHGVNGTMSHGTQPSNQLDASVNEILSTVDSSARIADTEYGMCVAMKTGRNGGCELVHSGFAIARLWPWEAILYRRLKRGLITTANYERRKVQNEEFGIKDAFVRASSGWWEEAEDTRTE